jgi:hypothetical protein
LAHENVKNQAVKHSNACASSNQKAEDLESEEDDSEDDDDGSVDEVYAAYKSEGESEEEDEDEDENEIETANDYGLPAPEPGSYPNSLRTIVDHFRRVRKMLNQKYGFKLKFKTVESVKRVGVENKIALKFEC